MPSYLLDTNHLGLAVRKGSPVAKRIEASRKAGNRVGTCLPVLCELQAGSRQVSFPDKYQRDLTHLLKQLRIWPLELTTTSIFGDIHAELRQMGRAASAVDLMVAALARQWNLILLTTDQDFRAIRGLVVEDWTV